MKGTLCAAGILLSAWTIPAWGVPLEVYGRLPSAAHVTISPDGTEIALVVADAQNHQIRVNKTADLSPIAVAPVSDAKILGLQWIGLDHLMIIYSRGGVPLGFRGPRAEFYLASQLDLRHGTSAALLDSTTSQAAINALVDWPVSAVIDGKPTVFLTTIDNDFEVGTIRQELDTHNGFSMSVLGEADTADLIVTASGGVVARVLYNRDSGGWSLWTHKPRPSLDWSPMPSALEGWSEVHREKALVDLPWVAGVAGNDDSLIIATNENGISHFHRLSLAGGDWGAALPELDDANVVFDPVTRKVIGTVVVRDTDVRYGFFDPKDQAIWNAVASAFPGETVRLSSMSADHSKLILNVEGAKSGAAYYLLDTVTHHADWISDEYRGVTADDLAPVRAIHYAAADGTDILGYLTLPRGLPAKNLPLVVLVHGGPEERDTPGFYWWSQALASLGYAVLQPEYRGSWGVAPGLVAAGWGQWGRKMQTDLSDGVASLARNGTIDPARVCIVGAGYGGYAAMAGVTLQSGIYRCAVSVGGISDLRRQLAEKAIESHGQSNPTYRYWQRFIGATSGGDPALDELSPAHHADRLSAPLLLIHGSIDTAVRPEQSRFMQEAAAKAGKSVQLVTLVGEDQNLARGATRLQMLQATADFLKANLPAASQ
jgi:dipeptidyl aminopeptidase/acylaminoacyl peptidase